MSLDLDAVRQRVDRITASQEQMTRNVDQLTREITKLQAIAQYILHKNSEPPAPKPVPRPSSSRPSR